MKKITGLFIGTLLAKSVNAHCPLCTAGIAAVAGGATYFGVNKTVISLFVGAFAVSTGWWVARSINKEYIRFQKLWLVLGSFLLSVLPLMSLLYVLYPLQISLAGDYGSLLNRTYLLNASLVSSIVGGIIVAISPLLSSKITDFCGSHLPFQGVGLTLLGLVIAGIFIQVGV